MMNIYIRTHTHSILTAILTSEPGLAACKMNIEKVTVKVR